MIRFCCAVWAVAFMPQLPSPAVCAALLLGSLLVLSRTTLRRWWPLLLGLAWGVGYGHWGLNHRLPVNWQGQDLQVVGQVVDLPVVKPDSCQFHLRVDQLRPLLAATAGDPPLPTALERGQWLPRKLTLSWFGCAEAIRPGQVWQLTVRLKRPHGYRNPGGFDRQRYLFSSAIDGQGYVRGGAALVTPDDPRRSVDSWRDGISAAIDQQVAERGSAAVLRALLVGDKRALSTDQWRLFRETGTLHLLVISGLHIGLISGATFALVLLIGRLLPGLSLLARQRSAVVAALAAALCYAALAGFTLPTQRALVMTTVVLLTVISRQQSHAAKRCQLAATLVSVLDPLAVLSAGFWLSFGAAATLLYLLCGRIGTRSAALQLVRVQLAMLLISLPLLAFNFYQVPLLAPLINLLAVPLVSVLVLPLAMGSLLLLAVFPPFGGLGLNAAGWLLGQGSAALEVVNQGVGLQWQPPDVTLWTVASAVLGAFILIAPKGLPGRWLGGLLWLPIMTAASDLRRDGDYDVTVLDVGQGLAVYVETRNHRLLFDTGARYRSGFAVAAVTVEPFLRQRGVTALDRLMVSHGDNDHAGGVGHLLQRLSVEQVHSGASRRQALARPCRAGQRWQWDGVTFRLLHPRALAPKTENNRSCVLLIESAAGRLLLTGDIEAAIERQLVSDYGDELRAELLLVPHHGSKTSSSGEFLDRVSPQLAIVSSGYRNRFGHPHDLVLQRYRQRHIELLNTADSGAIAVTFRQGKALRVDIYGEQHGRYWWNQPDCGRIADGACRQSQNPP